MYAEEFGQWCDSAMCRRFKGVARSTVAMTLLFGVVMHAYVCVLVCVYAARLRTEGRVSTGHVAADLCLYVCVHDMREKPEYARTAVADTS